MTIILRDDDGSDACEYEKAYLSFDEHDPDDMQRALMGLELRALHDREDPLLSLSIGVLRRALAKARHAQLAAACLGTPEADEVAPDIVGRRGPTPR